MGMIKLLIADDHKIVRNGLYSIFECEENFTIIGEAENGRELVEKAESLHPDVIISDLKMPYLSGIEAAAIIKTRFPDMKIIILTAFDEKEDVQLAINTRVDGYMIKDTLPDELVKAVELVYRGYTCIFPSDVQHMDVKSAQKRIKINELDEITDREMEVFNLIAQNYSNQEIAERLYISEATVKSHVSRILRKTGQPNRAQAVLYGLSRGIFNMKTIKRDQMSG